MTRVYIAGPMTGLPEYNYPAFNARAAQLRALGYYVENPAENPEPPCNSWKGYMRQALAQLVTCDVVDLLPGWEKSKCARIEHRLARYLEMEVWKGTPTPEPIKGLVNSAYMVCIGWPNQELSPNVRVHRMAKATAAKKYRAAAGWAALDAKLPRLNNAGVKRVDVALQFFPPANRRYDRDNLVASVKSGLDGIADHLRVNDHLFFLEAPQLMPHCKKRGACVLVNLKVSSEEVPA